MSWASPNSSAALWELGSVPMRSAHAQGRSDFALLEVAVTQPSSRRVCSPLGTVFGFSGYACLSRTLNFGKDRQL
jgi:hypothetical protein